MVKRHHHSGHYSGMEARRHQEMQDAGMLHEDHSAVANMPQNVMMKPWPSAGHYMPEDVLDDTIRGVDRQMGELDGGKERKHMVPKKV